MSAVLSAVQSPPTEVEAVERDLRVQLAAAYRLVEHFGWSELIYGHLTVRIPGEIPTFLINPYGFNYEEITASSLVRIGVDGNVVGESNHPVNRAGFVIHSAIHMANSVNKCVMHTHTRAGMAAAALEDGLLQVHMYSTGFHDRIAYHEYEGPSLDLGERERLLADLGDCNAMILRNHGILTVGAPSPRRSSGSTAWSAPARCSSTRWRRAGCTSSTRRWSSIRRGRPPASWSPKPRWGSWSSRR